jgi:prepilin signal peptidase PulO-like enzyme (type II secretory pathway)
VGAYCTSHWVTVIICMKFKEVWYLDSAKQHPPLKFLDLQNVLNWSVSCRFCSQKFNLLVFLISIANHAGPLVQYFLFTKNQSLSVSNWYCWSCRAFGYAQDRVTKGKKKKPKATLKHKTNLVVRPRFFYDPVLPLWYCINLSFCYLDAVCSAATGVLFVWIPCVIPYVKTTRWHTWHQEGCYK